MKNRCVLLAVLLSLHCPLPLEAATTDTGLLSWVSSWFARMSAQIPAEYRPSAKTVAIGTATGLGVAGLASWWWKYSTNKKAKSIPDIDLPWGVAERQGRRPTMEDNWSITKRDGFNLFAIYDGHGGSVVSDILAEGDSRRNIKPLSQAILDNVDNSEEKDEQSIKQAITQAFKDTDEKLRNIPYTDQQGSTALVALVHGQDVYLAWVGDSEGILLDFSQESINYKNWQKTDPHTPKSEAGRIATSGVGRAVFAGNTAKGPIFRVQLSGSRYSLGVARAFGDFNYKPNKEKPNPVIVDPDIKKINVGNFSHLILACDGVWDVISRPNLKEVILSPSIPENVSWRESLYGTIKLQGNNDEMQNAAKNLRDEAYYQGSTDNITAMVIGLKK